jgi:hypothetical protein
MFAFVLVLVFGLVMPARPQAIEIAPASPDPIGSVGSAEEVEAPASPDSEGVLLEPAPPVPPGTTPLGDVPDVPQDGAIPTLLVEIVRAAREGRWGLVLALSLMVGIWVFRRFFWSSIPSHAIPFVTLGVSAVAGFAASVVAGTTIPEALLVALGGLFSGFATIGAWETLGKRVLPAASTHRANPPVGT